jgi:hypothetical protein
VAISQQSIMDDSFRRVNMRADISANIDSFFITEDLFRDAVMQAVREQRFRKSYSVTMVNGSCTLPDLILEELNTLTVEGDTPTSFERSYLDFSNAPCNLINYATVRNNVFLYREAGDDASLYDGTLVINAVGMPAIPSTITDTIDIPLTLADRISEIIAEKIGGNAELSAK